MKLTLRTPWTRQPQTPAGVNRDYNLKRLWVPGLDDLVVGERDLPQSTPANGVVPWGMAYRTNNGSAERHDLSSGSSFVTTGSTGFSLLVKMRWGSTLGDGQGAGVRPVGGAVSLRATFYLGTAGSIFFDFGGATNGTTRVTGTTSTTAGRVTTYLATTGPRGMELWENGVLIASNGANPTRTSSGQAFSVGDVYGGFAGNADYGIVACWDGQIPTPLAALYSGDPLKLFAPIQRTIWVPSAGGGPTYTLTAASGSFALTGQDAGLAFNRVLAADTQSYTLTGQATGLAFNRTLAAASGSFTLTGQDAGLAFNRVLSAASGSFALDGQDVTLTYTPISGATYTLGAASGSFALTGQDTGLAFNRVLTADTQSYSLSGDVAGLAFNRVLTADTVSYALTGQDASLSYTGFTYKLMADSASFALTGQDASFEFSGTTGVGGGGREKQRKKVLKDIKRLNELILKRDGELDAEVITVATPKPKAPKPAKFDTALITAKAKQQVIDDEEDELMLLMY